MYFIFHVMFRNPAPYIEVMISGFESSPRSRDRGLESYFLQGCFVHGKHVGNACSLSPILHFHTISTTVLPFPHFLSPFIPSPHSSITNIVAIIILGSPLHQSFPERNIDSSLLSPLSTPLRYTVQPIRLRCATHKHHVATTQR